MKKLFSVLAITMVFFTKGTAQTTYQQVTVFQFDTANVHNTGTDTVGVIYPHSMSNYAVTGYLYGTVYYTGGLPLQNISAYYTDIHGNAKVAIMYSGGANVTFYSLSTSVSSFKTDQPIYIIAKTSANQMIDYGITVTKTAH